MARPARLRPLFFQKHAMTTPAKPDAAKGTKDNERPLMEDIRLLGRILGDVIREQEGVAAFELIEQIRKLSVAFRRHADQEADLALKKLLTSLSGDTAVSVIPERPALVQIAERDAKEWREFLSRIRELD